MKKKKKLKKTREKPTSGNLGQGWKSFWQLRQEQDFSFCKENIHDKLRENDLL